MVKFLKHDFSASVLATVLVVSTLLLLGVLMVIELWNFDLVRYNLYHQGEQARANVESGFLLYSRDSTLSYRWEGDSSVLLFGQREDSRVRYSRQRWGMYEVVEVQNGRHRSVRLLGKKAESFWRATLYVPENNRAFSVTGRTFAEGDVYLPRNGISYTQLRSEFFKGRALDKKQIKTSEERLPPLDEESRDVVNGLLDYAGEREWLENGSVLQRGFREPVVRVEVGEYLSGVRVSGPVILYASSMLFVEENNRLENVIIVGDRVEFADGFSGCVQVFARDTILLGNQVCLKAGSGLYVRQGEEKGFIRLGEECEVNGYVIAGAKVSEGEQKQLLYYQPESSRVRGLLYVDGIAEVHGFVTGSLYARECYYFAPEGYYSGVLYNAVLPGNPGGVYPLWMRGPYERREVKWLD